MPAEERAVALAATDRASSRPTRAIVLAVGGARGAYEAGVLEVLFAELPARLGHPVRLDFVLGSSVGGIHACYLAATADRTADPMRALRESWLDMQLEAFFGLRGLLDPRRLIGRLARTPALAPTDEGMRGFVDTTLLDALVRAQRTKMRAGGLPAVLRTALRLAGRLPSASEGDLLSYLLFERTYTEALFELGRAHARAREDELAAFFTD
jgi:hypothetical protein